MLAKHLPFQDRELFTLQQCLPKQSSVTLHQDIQRMSSGILPSTCEMNEDKAVVLVLQEPTFSLTFTCWVSPSTYRQWLTFEGSLQEQGGGGFRIFIYACTQSLLTRSPCSV